MKVINHISIDFTIKKPNFIKVAIIIVVFVKEVVTFIKQIVIEMFAAIISFSDFIVLFLLTLKHIYLLRTALNHYQQQSHHFLNANLNIDLQILLDFH